MTTRTITAIYDSETDARQARTQLVNNGLDDDDVRIVSQNLSSRPVSSDSNDDDKGIWESIKDFFVGDDDRPTYSEGIRRGGYLLTARVDDDRSDDAIALLESTNAVDLDERTEQWRAEGWSEDAYISGERTSQNQPASAPNVAATQSTTPSVTAAKPTQPAASAQSNTNADIKAKTAARQTRDQGNERAIPVGEERLRIGKREVNRGGVRVRSYVVQEPVHEEISLREERVEIERRPVSGATSAAGADVFREQTIELSERAEEAVVTKDAVVTGEVVVRKSTNERVESIDDTVRHTEVDVDDTRTAGKTPRGNRRPN